MEQGAPAAAGRRRAGAVALAAVLALGAAPTGASAQVAPPPTTDIAAFCADAPARDDFADVGDADRWAGAVRCLSHAHVTGGVTPTSFAPAARVTRQQMASFVARTMDVAFLRRVEDRDPTNDLVPLPAAGDPAGFTDVAASNPHATAIGRLAAAGIAQGGPGGLAPDRYGPDRLVTRAQMASFIARAVEHLTGRELPAGTDHFPDDGASAHHDAVNALAAAGIVAGYGDGTYRPENPVTRAEMAWFLTRPLANLHAGGAVAALPPAPPTDVALAVAGDGVVLTAADGSTIARVTTDPAHVAYAASRSVVAYQHRGPHPDLPAGPVRVWTAGGGTRALPLAPGRQVELLDARTVGGRASALVSEQSSDFVREVVVVDLASGSRTTVMRGSVDWDWVVHSGVILPDGDVVTYRVGISSFEGLVERWTPGAAAPRWRVPTGRFSRDELVSTPDGAAASLVAHSVDDPAVWVHRIDLATGALTPDPDRTTNVADPAGEMTGLLGCGDAIAPDVLVCTAGDGRPFSLDTRTDWFAHLSPRAGRARLIRTG